MLRFGWTTVVTSTLIIIFEINNPLWWLCRSDWGWRQKPDVFLQLLDKSVPGLFYCNLKEKDASFSKTASTTKQRLSNGCTMYQSVSCLALFWPPHRQLRLAADWRGGAAEQQKPSQRQRACRNTTAWSKARRWEARESFLDACGPWTFPRIYL